MSWPLNPDLKLYIVGGNEASLLADQGLWAASNFIARPEISSPGDRISDGAVTVMSSRGSYEKQVDTFVAHLPIFRDLNAAWYEENAFSDARLDFDAQTIALNHYQIKDDPAVTSWIADILSGGFPRPLKLSGSHQITSRLSSAAAPVPLTTNWVAVDEMSGSLSPNSVAARNLPLSGEGAARWTVTLSGSGVGVRLVRPRGAGWISGAGSDVDWEVVNGGVGIGSVVNIKLHQPEAGVWGIELSSAGLAQSTDYSVSVDEVSKVQFEASPHKMTAAGGVLPMLVKTTWDNGLTVVPAIGGTVQATVIAPDDSESLVTLADDGLQGDGVAGDGIQGLLADGFSSPGLYSVIYRINLPHPQGGQPIRRLARSGFTRAASGGYIAGIVGHHAVDADGDGYPEAVVLEVRVDATVPDDFTLSGVLEETDGSTKFEAVTEFHRDELGGGVVTLVFDAHRLPQGRECGPFSLAELRLIRATGQHDWLHDYPTGYQVPVRLYNPFSRHIRVTGDFDFGWVKTGQVSTHVMRIYNDGWESLSIGSLSLPDHFTGDFTGVIEPGSFHDVAISFAPVTAELNGGAFGIESNAVAGEVNAVWSGRGYRGVLLQDWLANEGVPPEQRGALDDPNGDGVPNLLSYLFNLHPATPGYGSLEGALPVAQIGADAGGRFLALRYRHNQAAEGLTVGMEISENLNSNSWENVIPYSVTDAGIDGATGDPIREMRVRIGDKSKEFVRLVVREGTN
ncbi:MAG: choice-of-anchor X domain-containing protein [Luteolibacter sp.]